MVNWLNYYQHLPGHINSAAPKVGIFLIDYYSLMYILAFLTVYLLLIYRIKKKEGQYSKNLILDFMFYAILGVLIGGRLGYVIFYNFPYYLAHPLEIFLPIQATGYGLQVTGYYGMSFHGGLLGVILAGYIFSKKQKINFWKLADFVVPVIPAGYFFGRIGNFLNGELYGRATNKFWGMYFPASTETQNFASLQLRHPSQLYEAFFEGLVIFIILWTLRNTWTSDVQAKRPKDIRCPAGSLLLFYLFLYGLFRFFIEFFREPDSQVGLIFGFLTLGQLLSLAMIASGAAIFFVRRRKNRYNTITT